MTEPETVLLRLIVRRMAVDLVDDVPLDHSALDFDPDYRSELLTNLRKAGMISFSQPQRGVSAVRATARGIRLANESMP